MVFKVDETDYSVYLVTDSSLVPEGKTFLGQVEAAIDGGATIVQLREKNLSTRDFIKRAQEVHELTKTKNIPLIINDRVDVALAIDAEGVHVGQDDMDVRSVRRLIGPGKLLGLSVSNLNETYGAIKDRDVLDYVGIGAVFDTSTKKLVKKPQGFSGVREVLSVLHNQGGDDIKTVAIGGINDKNSSALLYTATSPGKSLDGIAIVSVIMGSETPKEITEKLVQLVKSGPSQLSTDNSSLEAFVNSERISNVLNVNPLTHQITNGVVKNFSANVTLSIGGSPIMSENVGDFKALANVPNSALLINAGTVNPTDSFEIYSTAITTYNIFNKPIVFDPVGAGASPFRKSFTRSLLNAGYINVIKGNPAEILTVAGVDDIVMKGVDSGDFTVDDILIKHAKKLALDTRSIVVITGKTDLIIEGNITGSKEIPENVEQKVVAIEGGHPLMGKITGSGCSLGSTIASYLGANPNHQFEAVVAAVALYNQAGSAAGKQSTGPGTFVSSFIDNLYIASQEKNPESWDIKVSYH